MPLYFVTGNPGKFQEARAILPGLEQLEIDLPEIQEIDAKAIVKAKLLEALGHREGEIIIEDTSLYLDCLGGLPGPLIKWFLGIMGNDGLFGLALRLGNVRAEAKTIVGYARSREEIYFFEGVLEGEIVAPKGDKDFGWGPIFRPEGFARTFGEMEKEEKNPISMRGIALAKLRDFLESGE